MSEEFIEHLSLVEELSDDQLVIIRPLIERINFEIKKEIFKQGEAAHYLYLIVEGEVIIRFNPKEEAALVITKLGEGDLFGWSAALGCSTYTSSAIGTKKGELLRIKGDHLKNIYRKYPEIGLLIVNQLASVIASRLTNIQDQVAALLNHSLQEKTGG